MSKPLPECAVAITGGTSGVGLATAHAFAAQGVTRLALLGRDPDRGTAAREQVLAAYPGLDVHYVRTDASDHHSAVAAAHTVDALLEGFDVLVNSTQSQWVPDLARDIPLENARRILLDQAMPPINMSLAALPYMTERQFGVILNIASDAAKLATPGESVIGAGMAAIVMFSRTLAMEAKRNGIRVNAVTPSLIQGTPGGDRVMAGGFSKKLFEKAAAMAHLGVPEADDLAALIVFLAGPGAARITGQAISVNGGISAG
ncbi:MAG TPA: SDR family oxidoreductase [Sporichthyaceae bacterium]|nr:SDR family oxidoreductase [Sporichthyaceae bacterium]